MLHPALKNIWYTIAFFVIGILIGIMQEFAIANIVEYSWNWILIQGILFGTTFFLISIPLWIILQFIDFKIGSVYQQIINPIGIAIIIISAWIGLQFCVMYIIAPNSILTLFTQSLAIRIFICIVIYISIALYSKTYKSTNQAIEDIELDEVEIENNIEAEKTIESIDRITIKNGQKIHVIGIEEIYYLQAEGDYVMIFTKDGKFLKEQTMKYFEMHLSSQKFVRIHRSFLVNVTMISSVELYEKQNYKLILQNGHILKASIAGYKLLKKTLQL